MAYPHEAQIRRWLENWVRWSPGTVGKSQWSGLPSSHVYEGAPIPIMSGEAADTQDALKRCGRDDSRLLTRYHLGRGTVASMARHRRISLATLSRRLHDAHQRFYELRCAMCAALRHTGQANALVHSDRGGRRRTTVDADVRKRLQRVRARPPGGGH